MTMSEDVKLYEILLKTCHVENVAPKEWGYEVWIVNEQGICLKILVLYPGYICSDHKHFKKFEAFLILDGPIEIQMDGRTKIVSRGDLVKVHRYGGHRFRALGGTAAFLEASTQHSEDDSHRTTSSHRYDLGGKTVADILGLVGKFRDLIVLLVGDFIVDQWEEGPSTRLSPEAPCPVVLNPGEFSTAGGAGNTGRNIAALGAKCHAVGVCGEDKNAVLLRTLLEVAGVEPHLVVDNTRPTTSKRRTITGTHHHVRVDREVTTEVSKSIQNQLIEQFAKCLQDCEIDVVVVTDYGKGTLTQEFMREIIAMAGDDYDKPLPVVVDPRSYHWDWYQLPGDNRRVDTLKPNVLCMEEMAKTPFNTELELVHAAEEARKRVDANHMVLTRGPRGMTVLQHDEETAYHIPARVAEVAEVSGAGDTVTAVLGLCRALRMDITEAAEIANVAASLVVRKKRTASVLPTELAAALKEGEDNAEASQEEEEEAQPHEEKEEEAQDS
jgi:D-beta-D-heptose 7-phosphate kinase/D-beta-D-heptose 1-phosphate adenosyltransferase